LVRKGGFTEWKEVLCGHILEGQTGIAKVQEIQRALQAKGYDPGPLDNIIGPRTKAALVKFQKDNGLPIGALDIQTLKALGVSAK
jgi:peptidoglycan hydrolase-like protein with peptidoglycan-binding domain